MNELLKIETVKLMHRFKNWIFHTIQEYMRSRGRKQNLKVKKKCKNKNRGSFEQTKKYYSNTLC